MSRAALFHIGQPEAEPVEIHTAVDALAWDAYVNRHPEASVYHLWAWRAVFERAFGHRCIYLTATRGGRAVGVLPLVLFASRLFGRFLVSLPFVNYGGVLADDSDIAAELADSAAHRAAEARVSHVELRHRRRMLDGLPVKQHKVAMIMPLAATTDAVWTALDRKVRNQIRKAEKSGLTATSGGGELLADFYGVFARNMRDLGTPVYALAFFEEVLSRGAGRARVYVVRHQRRVVAAGISLQFRDGIEVPWAASLTSYRPSCPNHLLYWSVIREAVASGCTALDFGRSTPDEGTFHFKRQWGAVAAPLYWEYLLLTRSTLPDHSPRNPRFAPAIAIWKRLPVSVTRLLGPPIVRSIP